MTLGILAELLPENRVGVTPDTLAALTKLGFQQILLEKGAGARASISDAAYEQQGATVADLATVLEKANVLVKIQPLTDSQAAQLSSGQIVIGQFNLLSSPELVEPLLKSQATVFSLDLLPRTTRAQVMDVLSSMATVAGYKAVLLAANHLPSFFPMFMTAAGTVKPAKVLILGAGVAGLQAIATAKRMGAVVEAFDVRQAAKEEVLSLGAKFVEVEGAVENVAAGGYAIEQSEDFKKRQATAIQERAMQSDVVICTAQIPGKRAPVLLRKESVEAMKPGSVVVDLAASTGGNCEVTENGKTIRHTGVTIIGDSNLPSSVPRDASAMFGKNVLNFLKLLVQKGEVNLNFEDDILAASCVAHQGEIISKRLQALVPVA